MVLAVPRESWPGERRVAATPETVAKLVGMGFDVRVEANAGLLASFADDDYSKAGATIVSDRPALWAAADVLLMVQPPSTAEADQLKAGATLISFLWPAKNQELIERLAGAQGHRARHGPGAAHHARAEDGRAVVDGQHRRLPRGHRGRRASTAASSPGR